MKDEFYLTLPSNAGMGLYPKNTMSQYITKLPQRLNLEGDWEVALVEIQIPQSWDNVQFHYNDNSRRVTLTILKENTGVAFLPQLEDMLGFPSQPSSTDISKDKAIKIRAGYPADISRGVYNVYVNTLTRMW